MRMQVILDSLFARPGPAPILGGKKGEFRDWTNINEVEMNLKTRKEKQNNGKRKKNKRKREEKLDNG